MTDDLHEAARVSRFMDELQSGRWRTRRFTVTQHEYDAKRVKLAYEDSDKHPDRLAQELQRCVPPGEYICLSRKMTDEEVRDAYKSEFGWFPWEAPDWMMPLERVMPEDVRWAPIMSDTPSEIFEHQHAFDHAQGNVLITGLGLGCLPHALLAKQCPTCQGTGVIEDWDVPGTEDYDVAPTMGCPGVCGGDGLAVKRIDIIEIDPDVMALTGRYLTDERVHIHRGSAADPSVLPDDLRFDYAWHDIWSHISSRNLEHEVAEHGISYTDLFNLYTDRAELQGAWAYPEALEMLRIEREEAERERVFRAYILSLPRDEWWKPMYERVLRDRVHGVRFSEDEVLPDSVRRMLDPRGDIAAEVRRKVAEPGFEELLRSSIVTDGIEDEPVGFPNASLEN